MSEWHPLGKHRFEVLGDVLLVETAGEVDPAETHQIMKLMEDLERDRGRALALFDVTLGASMPPESRKIIAHWDRRGSQPAPTAIVGASLAMRALALLITNAIRLVTHKRVPLAFCKSQADGHKWLAGQRNRQVAGRASASAEWPVDLTS
jgi:hypothetical protein